MSSSKKLRILVISLKSDEERRNQLKKRFPGSYCHFEFIEAIDLRLPGAAEKFQIPPLSMRPRRNPLSLAEIGCALSHMKALSIATEGRGRSTLILEDDIIGADEDIDSVTAILQRLPSHHFLLAGGQEGLRGSHHLYGTRNRRCFHLPRIVHRYIARACCYAVSPSMARIIHDRQKISLERADNWNSLLKGEQNIFFTQQLEHPFDLSDSHLESSRSKALQLNLWRRILNDGFFYTLTNQITKATLPWIARVRKWEKIDISHKWRRSIE